jgi:hypothetical protein
MRSSCLSIGAVALALAALVPAQTATYTTFGSGCAGYCSTANPGTTVNSALTQNANIFALRVPPTTNNVRVVHGFELFTQSLGTGPLTFNTQIYGATSTGMPTTAPIANGTMTLGKTQNWYKTTFTPPLLVLAGKTIFISYTSVRSGMKFPIANVGTKVSHFWHPPTATKWNGAPPLGFVTQAWAWKLTCAPGPSLSNTGVPTLNTSMTVDLSSGGANNNAIFALGISNTTWGNIPLPLDLTPINALCCKLLVSLDFQFLVTSDASGKYSFRLSVPNNNALKGLKFYNQYAINAPGVNGFGVLMSQGGVGTIN